MQSSCACAGDGADWIDLGMQVGENLSGDEDTKLIQDVGCYMYTVYTCIYIYSYIYIYIITYIHTYIYIYIYIHIM